MNSVKLSVCIPTYNRARHLHDCLSRCLREFNFDFPYEIVVSDNASTDDTYDVVQEFLAQGAPIRYFRSQKNVGMIPNMNSAFRLGRGEYLTYLADDDRLIPEEVANIVHFLDANQNVTVCHAPWFIYDAVEEQDGTPFYRIEQDTIFPKQSFADVFNFMFRGHVFPEVAIYRGSALRAAWVPREICFFPFTMLAHFLDEGDVAFRKTPFYRQVIRSAVERDRAQGGHEIAMTGWDQYRGGLEYFLYFGAKRGKVGTSENDRATQEHLCKTFTMERMAVAIRLLVAQREFLKCYELYCRMEFGGMGGHKQLAAIRDGLPLAAALETLAGQLHASAGVNRLIISGFTDPWTIRERLAKVRFPEKVTTTGEPTDHTDEIIEHSAVLVSRADQRDHFLSLGYMPNLVFSQDDLIKTIVL
ncbi:glycosyltransferase family 2 protein [Neorhizobium alkalisoli]|uniref:Glycosyltransferase involved in cell wall biosynthesis n=1 Tax=Neorhizobium alkalisoli TaxID=528178 RepID=A0A561QSI6_9HYPH|nr:glycosyltransferase family 2 protein [Neorhizobium alkalisoli]TWF53363.1 glycosyltransferase involved in cell wall biosynthesis [Neorhizobium alkalisoli]